MQQKQKSRHSYEATLTSSISIFPQLKQTLSSTFLILLMKPFGEALLVRILARVVASLFSPYQREKPA